MNAFKFLCLFILGSVIFFNSCSAPKSLELKLPPEGEFFQNLSEYGILSNSNKELKVNEELASYTVINELFSDYAEKGRYVYVPDGKPAKLQENGFFEWQEGSVFVKNFYYNKEQIGEERIMETRLLIRDSKNWKAISYIWDKNQQEAKISKVGDVFPLSINHNDEELDFDYVVPNKNQCKSCHNYNERIDPLGFKYSNLNTTIQNSEGEINQLAFLASQGIIELNDSKNQLSTMISYNEEEADLQQRALAYLDINCGHCHRPEGPGNTSGLYLQYDEERTNHLGFCKGPVAAGKGSGGRSFDVFPGSADSSILYYRMASVDPGVMMPEVGRGLAHKEGLAIVKEWIDNLDYDCYSQELE